MRAGVEIVIGNMCLRQTKQKKESVPDESPTCVYVYLFLYLCHSVKYKLEKLQDALLSNPHEPDDDSSLISFLFSCCSRSV